MLKKLPVLFSRTNVLLLGILLLSGFLRMWRLSDFPVSLYTDEANQGYNAYSLLHTGRDEHGAFLPLSLRSFGDWKPPLPTYLMIPFFLLSFSLETAVRLPSAIFGLGTILLVYFFARILTAASDDTTFPLLSSFFLAISPWHIFQSRAAMLVSVSLFFLTSGVAFFFLGKRCRPFLFVSALSFVLSLYSYYGLRVTVPLVVFFLLWIQRADVIRRKNIYLASAAVGFAFLFPLFLSFLRQPDVLFGRAKTVSVFYDSGVRLVQWEEIAQDGISGVTPLESLFFHNAWYKYTDDISRRFFSHFHPNYLFLSGDTSQPFQIPHMGILNFAEGAMMILGFLYFFRYRTQWAYLLLVWICASILPAAFTFMTPSSNRTFSAVIPYMIFAGWGTLVFFRKWKHIFSPSVLVLAVCGSLYYFLVQYFLVLPAEYSRWWNWGWKEVVAYVSPRQSQFDSVVVFDTNGMPYIYFLLYGHVRPEYYHDSAVRTYVADRFGFEHVEGFGSFVFPTDWDWKTLKSHPQKNTLYVVPAELSKNDTDYTHALYYPNGELMVKIFSLD